MEPYIGEIRLFAGNYAPKGWHFCDGSLMSISQNTALFSILGSQYGGDAKTTFALPDLRGSVPIHWGQGPGLSYYAVGETGGSQNVTLLQLEMPYHSHAALSQEAEGVEGSPTGAFWAEAEAGGRGGDQTPLYTATANTQMNYQALSVIGGSQPHNNMQPYLALSFIIALEGVYPPKS